MQKIIVSTWHLLKHTHRTKHNTVEEISGAQSRGEERRVEESREEKSTVEESRGEESRVE